MQNEYNKLGKARWTHEFKKKYMHKQTKIVRFTQKAWP